MGKFEIKQTNTGFVFNLKARNGEIIANGSEVYTTLNACKNGIESVRNNSRVHIEDQTVDSPEALTHPKYELYKDKKEEFRFRLKARNGEIIAKSEGYASKAGCKNGIESIGNNAPDAEVEMLA